MFTGIVAAVGRIESITPLDTQSPEQSGLRLHIHAGGLPLADVTLGDSIALQGACMTVIEKTESHFDIEISRESLSKTVGLDQLAEVNLEKALTLEDRLGGHLVSGHIDGIAKVVEFSPTGESTTLKILASKNLGKYLAYKGSVVINGVSLTINQVEDSQQGCTISINLIPHTIQMTTLKHLQVNAQVNLEIDLLARYCERLLSAPK